MLEKVISDSKDLDPMNLCETDKNLAGRMVLGGQVHILTKSKPLELLWVSLGPREGI